MYLDICLFPYELFDPRQLLARLHQSAASNIALELTTYYTIELL